jgi:hypothetical protein
MMIGMHISLIAIAIVGLYKCNEYAAFILGLISVGTIVIHFYFFGWKSMTSMHRMSRILDPAFYGLAIITLSATLFIIRSKLGHKNI